MDLGVTPFSRWDKELPKMERDSRYSLVANPSEEIRLRQDKEKMSRDGFTSILEFIKIRGSIGFYDP